MAVTTSRAIAFLSMPKDNTTGIILRDGLGAGRYCTGQRDHVVNVLDLLVF